MGQFKNGMFAGHVKKLRVSNGMQKRSPNGTSNWRWDGTDIKRDVEQTMWALIDDDNQPSIDIH